MSRLGITWFWLSNAILVDADCQSVQTPRLQVNNATLGSNTDSVFCNAGFLCDGLTSLFKDLESWKKGKINSQRKMAKSL